jgi:hypothetical protein
MGEKAATAPHLKDEALDQIAAYGNVAQFASFDPRLAPRFSRIVDHPPNEGLEVTRAVATLMSASPEGRVNVRSFTPASLQGNEFIYGLSESSLVTDHVRRLAALGYFVIVNETIDVNDRGVSGVVQGSVVEFAPGGTPRVVDNGRPASLRLACGSRVLRAVYGFVPDLEFPSTFRVEFSIHPVKRGWRRTHTIIWELQELGYAITLPSPSWPNDFSEFIGDKVFGLLVAHSEGYYVPWTTVLSRSLPPFSFGESTGSDVKWIRTCPRIATPGRFTTVRGWTDPFKLIAAEDPDGSAISSVVIQEEVNPKFSGALLTSLDGEPIIEGVAGSGDALMLGGVAPTTLPEPLIAKIKELHHALWSNFGAIRLEWVFDGEQVWIVQLQQEPAKSTGTIIVSGEFTSEVTFRTEEGLDRLRMLAAELQDKSTAIKLIGNIGVTSHMADILRRTNIPSRLVRQ